MIALTATIRRAWNLHMKEKIRALRKERDNGTANS
jgi:hypothetical protein